MTEDQLRDFITQFIKENIVINIDTGYNWGDRTIEVSLELDGEVISKSTTTLPTPELKY